MIEFLRFSPKKRLKYVKFKKKLYNDPKGVDFVSPPLYRSSLFSNLTTSNSLQERKTVLLSVWTLEHFCSLKSILAFCCYSADATPNSLFFQFSSLSFLLFFPPLLFLSPSRLCTSVYIQLTKPLVWTDRQADRRTGREGGRESVLSSFVPLGCCQFVCILGRERQTGSGELQEERRGLEGFT